MDGKGSLAINIAVGAPNLIRQHLAIRRQPQSVLFKKRLRYGRNRCNAFIGRNTLGDDKSSR